MTSLQIIPNWKNKTAKFKGTIAAGEHVAVSIANDDNYITDTTNLRLRVVNPANGKTLAQFPMPVEVLPLDALEGDGTGEAEETWDSDLTPLQCTLDLNTDRMLMAVPPAANVPLLFVLDAYEGATDEDEGEFTLYFKDMCEVTHWPRRVGEDEPTRLDDYKDLIEDFNTRLTTAETNVAAAEAAAVSAAGSAATAAAHAGNSETGAEAAMRAAQTYASNASTAKTAAETAQGKAEDAQTAAETAQGKAEGAQAAAEAAQAAAEAALPLDTTLSIEGKAADAKAVGDALAGKQGTISDLSAIRSGAEAGATAYQKPQDGIPKSDLASAVQASLGKADTALQSHQDISHKADKSTTYTKSEVDAIVAAVKTGSRQIVASLDDVTSPQPLVIYMVAKESALTANAYDEYIWITVSDVGRWEKIGDTEIDLSGYVQKETGKGLSTEDYTTSEKTKLSGIAAGAQVNVIETVKVNGTALTPTAKAVDIDLTGKLDKSGGTMTGNLTVQANGASVKVVDTDVPSSPYTALLNGKIVTGNINAQTAEIALPDASGVAALLENIAPDFADSASYAVGDLTVYGGALYRCTTAHQGSWAAADFAVCTVEDVLAALRLALAGKASVSDVAAKAAKTDIAPEFDATATYDPGDLVYHEGQLFKCINQHTGQWGQGEDFSPYTVEGAIGDNRSAIGLLQSDKNYLMQQKVPISSITLGWYSSSGAYAVGDIVFKMAANADEAYLMRCTVAGTGAEAQWESITVEDLIAAKQDSLSAAQLANIAAVPNKADAADLRYALVEKTIADDAVTLDDRASNEVVVPAPASNATEVTLTLNLPAAVSGRARDLLVRLDLTNVPTTGIDIGGISFAPASGETATFEVKGNAWPENEVGKVNLWSFTETKTAGKWAVGRETLTTVTQGGGS